MAGPSSRPSSGRGGPCCTEVFADSPAPGRPYRGGRLASRSHSLGTPRTLTCPARLADATDGWTRAVTAKGPEAFTCPTSWRAPAAAPHAGDSHTTSQRATRPREVEDPHPALPQSGASVARGPHSGGEASWHRAAPGASWLKCEQLLTLAGHPGPHFPLPAPASCS